MQVWLLVTVESSIYILIDRAHVAFFLENKVCMVLN